MQTRHELRIVVTSEDGGYHHIEIMQYTNTGISRSLLNAGSSFISLGHLWDFADAALRAAIGAKR